MELAAAKRPLDGLLHELQPRNCQVRDAVVSGRLQVPHNLASRLALHALADQRRVGDVATELLEPLVTIGTAAHGRMHAETLNVGARPRPSKSRSAHMARRATPSNSSSAARRGWSSSRAATSRVCWTKPAPRPRRRPLFLQLGSVTTGLGSAFWAMRPLAVANSLRGLAHMPCRRPQRLNWRRNSAPRRPDPKPDTPLEATPSGIDLRRRAQPHSAHSGSPCAAAKETRCGT